MTTSIPGTAPAPRQPTLSEVAALVGGDDSSLHAAILATGATHAEIERALVLATEGGETLGEEPHGLEGRVAAVYDILMRDMEADEA